jgi:hypothetical protein
MGTAANAGQVERPTRARISGRHADEGPLSQQIGHLLRKIWLGLVGASNSTPGSASHRQFARDWLTGPRRSYWLGTDATLEQPPSSSRGGGSEHVLGHDLELENFEQPAANAEQAVKDRYARKLQQISELIISAGPDLVGVQEVLADCKDLAPRVFDDLLAALGAEWNGCLSQRPDPRGIRVGWLARGQLSNPTDMFVYPQQVPVTTIDDDGNQITVISRSRRGALAVTYTRSDGLTAHASPPT